MSERASHPFRRAAIVVALAVIAIIASIHLIYRDRALPGVYVGDVSMGGKSRADIVEEVKRRSEDLFSGATTGEIPADEVGRAIDPEATADAALQAGREGGLASVLTPSMLGFSTEDTGVRYSLIEARL